VIRAMLITDTHWQAGKEMIPAYKAAKAFAKTWKPDLLVHMGDLSDWDFISVFSRDLVGKIEGQTWRKEYDTIARELDYWQKVSKNVSILLGNHDERVYTTIDRTPSLRGLVDFETMLGLKARKIPMFRDTEQPYKLGKLNVVHGWYFNKYHTNKHLDVFSGNMVYGHVHRFQTFSKVLQASKQEIQAWSLGCLCDKEPEYMNGCPSGWQHGFAVVYIQDDGNFNLYPVNVIGKSFVFEGKEYAA
jgi:predicted phosphodiesterase